MISARQLLFRRSLTRASVPIRGAKLWICLAGMSLLVSMGCEGPEGIRSYMVKKSPPSSQMLAAIIPHGTEAWFFKMTGPNAAVAAQAEPFEKLVKSVQFDEAPTAEPKWILPAGWTRRAGDTMRFATLEVEADSGKLECSISKLPRGESPLEEYLLANINRWRGQMGLSPLSPSELSKETTAVPLAVGSQLATVINIQGDLKGGGMGAAPFAGGGGAPASRAGSAATAADSKLTFQAPASWTQGELEISRSGIVVRRDAAFEVQDGPRRVEIAVTKLPAAAGATLPNVNRWRGQIGMPELSAEQFAKEKKELDVAGVPGDYVHFSGSQQAILGVIVERSGLAWFIKLQGDRELAQREQQNFEDFVRSIRFE